MSSLILLYVSSVQVNNIMVTLFIDRPRSDSAYRQKVQKMNDEKAMIQNDIMPQNEVGTLDLYTICTNHDAS